LRYLKKGIGLGGEDDGDDDNEDVFSDRTPFRQILKKLCSDYVVANIDRENALWMLERVRMVIPFALC